MTPTAISLIGLLAPYALALAHSAFIHWQSSKSHDASVAAMATTAERSAQAGAQAAVSAIVAAGNVHSDTLKQAGAIAATAAAAAVATPPQVTVQDPTKVDDGK